MKCRVWRVQCEVWRTHQLKPRTHGPGWCATHARSLYRWERFYSIILPPCLVQAILVTYYIYTCIYMYIYIYIETYMYTVYSEPRMFHLVWSASWDDQVDGLGDSLTGRMQSSPCRPFLCRGFVFFIFSLLNLMDVNAKDVKKQTLWFSMAAIWEVRMVTSRPGGHIESQAR